MMQSTNQAVTRLPSTPAHSYAAIAGVFLLALGILSLVIETPGFGTVGNVDNQPQFIIWATSGWTSIFWIVMGALGLLALGQIGGVRAYALGAGIVFAVVAIWGFIDGNNAFGIFAADTTNNITHAILAALGLLAGAMPYTAPQPHEAEGSSGGRFSRTQRTAPRQKNPTAGQR